MKTPIEVSTRTLLVVIASLLTLTLLSWAISLVHPPGALGLVIGIGIAVMKVMLVVLFFMELRVHRGGVRFVAITGPLFLVTLTFLMLIDVWTR